MSRYHRCLRFYFPWTPQRFNHGPYRVYCSIPRSITPSQHFVNYVCTSTSWTVVNIFAVISIKNQDTLRGWLSMWLPVEPYSGNHSKQIDRLDLVSCPKLKALVSVKYERYEPPFLLRFGLEALIRPVHKRTEPNPSQSRTLLKVNSMISVRWPISFPWRSTTYPNYPIIPQSIRDHVQSVWKSNIPRIQIQYPSM